MNQNFFTFLSAGEIVFGELVVVEPECDPNTMGDIDGNGTVDFSDFLILSGNFGQTVEPCTGGDINGDGEVTFAVVGLGNNIAGKRDGDRVGGIRVRARRRPHPRRPR